MRKISKFLPAALLTVAFSLTACSASAGIREIPDGALIVDVRTPGEFAADRFPGAINIPLDTVEARLKDFGDKTAPIVVYCRSGRRSGIAKDILTKHGFTNVLNGGGLRQMKPLAPSP